MPEIKPFRGLRYNRTAVKDFARIVAPPYDVISKEEQEKLYQKHPQNVIRLELGKEEPGDNEANNKYKRANNFMHEWISKNILMQEGKPSIYICVQDYKEDGKIVTRVGFFAAMKIDERFVLKHENTLSGPKEDRMSLLKETRTNLSPIFGLFEDGPAKIQKLLARAIKRSADLDVRIDAVRHRLFVESDPALVNEVCKQIRSKPMFIADGHHRFEVAKRFKDSMLAHRQGIKSGSAGWEYVMTYFSDCLHNPFKIYPTHRLLNVAGSIDALQLLRSKGDLKKVGNLKALLKELAENRAESKDKKYKFGAYLKNKGFFVLTLDPSVAKKVGKSPVEKLDVSVLHKHIIEPGFKISAVEKSKDIDFTRDAEVAKKKIDVEEFDIALFLRPTSMKEMIEVSKKGLKMPQKSTYFYPKLLSGLVFHKFEEVVL